MYKIKDLYSLEHTLADEYLSNYTYPWESLKCLKDFIIETGNKLDSDYEEVEEHVWVHKTAKIYGSAYIGSPSIIGPNSEVRHCAYIRGSVLVGENCVIGNSVELKNVILFDNVQVPHYNYVGDSILGYKVHMGAGSITSNKKSNNTLVKIVDKKNNITIETNLKKVGAMIGDNVEIGCNSVLNPGTIIGKDTIIYPLSSVRGIIEDNSIYKNENNIIKKIK